MNIKCERPGHCGLVTICAYCELDTRKRLDAALLQVANLRAEVGGYKLECQRVGTTAKDALNDLKAGNLQVEEYRKFCEMLVGSVETDITFWKRRAQFSLDAMEKQNDVSCNVTLDGGETGPYRCGHKRPCPDHDVQKRVDPAPKNDWVPKDWHGSFGTKHDMWTGPCSCGAFHREGQ